MLNASLILTLFGIFYTSAHIFLVSFNTDERCLDEEAYMKSVIELNPSAEWVIKPVAR